MFIKKRVAKLGQLLRKFWHALVRNASTLMKRWVKPTRSGKLYLAIPLPSRKALIRFSIVAVLLLAITFVGYNLYRYFGPHSYAVNSASSLLPTPSAALANSISFDSSKHVYKFASGTATNDASRQTQATPVTATLPVNASDGVTVSDPTYSIDFSMTPQYALADGKQTDGTRIVYPFRDHGGWLVYTAQGTGIKEDIVLDHENGDKRSFSYNLGLPSGTEARLENDGSIGVYGNELLINNVATSTANDAALLDKARATAAKNLLLFTIPKPSVAEATASKATISAKYELNGSRLTVIVGGLANASYPLSIDPSIYVVTAQQFMNGNNETNIDFDVANKVIKKGSTTGARFDSWNSTMSLNTSLWKEGVAVAGGYIYTVGGTHPAGGSVPFTSPGTTTDWIVPTGITSISVKAWGAGGGGGGGGRNTANTGGDGGAGAYATTSLSVTPGETLHVTVGSGGGGGGGSSSSGAGGGGGGFTRIDRGGTTLIVAAGGAGGGGGGRTTGAGAAGGGGGDTTGQDGDSYSSAGGGGGAGGATGGSGGTGGRNSGSSGSSLLGGDGADGRSSQGNDGGESNGGTPGGGAGGARDIVNYYAGGGGGGGGYAGGGGGSDNYTSAYAAAGGGGGSSYTTGSGGSMSAAVYTTPGNSTDSDRGTAGDSGGGGARRSSGSSGSAGYALISYTSSTGATSAVNWAKFNTSNGQIESSNPGNGACSGWCTSSNYDLPAPRNNFSLVAYNGFLYAIGGEDSSCTVANGTGDSGYCKTVYVSKLGANGEPQLWNPTWNPATDPNKTTWSFWYRDTDLSQPRSNIKVVAYNNRMYLMGGVVSNGGSKTVSNSMLIADITATGTLGSWTSGTTLPYNVYGYGAHAYNDRLYLIGGDSSIGGAPLSSVYYTKINADGTINSWVPTTPLLGGRMATGADFTTIWGGYVYLSGGCSAVNGSGYCTSINSDTQVASINADGSLDTWNNVGGVSDARTGHNLVAWRNYIYEVGGCDSISSGTGTCTSALATINMGAINQDGDASTVNASQPYGTSPCSGGTPDSCDLPGTSYVGNILPVSVVANGYLYVMGGCTSTSCGGTSQNVTYVAISSTGVMTAPTCNSPNTLRGGIWCVDTTNTLSGGVAAASPVVFNNTLYVVGGLDGGGNTGNLWHTALNNDGSINSWGAPQTLSSLGVNSVSYSYSFVRANPTNSANPGNLYILGGCTATSNMGCTAYSQNVYKCNISSSGTVNGCTTGGQQQIGNLPGGGTGLGIMSGTIYAGYIYLIGGVNASQQDMKTLLYAKVDSNNNIVTTAQPGDTTSSTGWVQSPNEMAVGRRRASAFGYNGYIYVVGGYDAGTGVLADIEFIKVNVTDGSLGSATDGFRISAVSINHRWGLSLPVSNSYAYAIGGCTVGNSPSCSTATDNIQTFQIYNNDSGAPASYSTSANTYSTDPNRLGVSTTVLNGKLYVAGGCTSTVIDCDAASTNVSYATIDSNGNLGAWTSTTAPLPGPRTWGKLVNAGGSLYYVGGQSSTSTDERGEVYYATPSSGGNVTSWSTATNGLPAARTKLGVTVWNNRIYAVGGLNTSAAATNTVYVSPQLNSGGNITSSWTSSTAFNVARSGATVTSYANNLYVLGGYDGTNYLSDVQYVQIDATTGLINGNWQYSASLPRAISQADSFAANGYIYLLGGRSSDTDCSRETITAPISANTSISSGNNPTGVGAWYITNERFAAARYGNAASYYDGKAYVVGGADCSVAASSTVLNSPGVRTYTVPAGVTSLQVKTWSGGGGGGGGGGTGTTGGAGGGSAYATATVSVTPGEVLSVSVGYGGGGGARNTSGFGGGGGGDSGIRRTDAGNTPLIIAGGGGAGGGARNASGSNGGAGGAGGTAASGVAGSSGAGTSPFAGGGGGGTASAGGAAGLATGEGNSCTAQAGGYLDGGQGADGRTSSCTLGGAGNSGSGFLTGAGDGGSAISTTRAGGGGGGSGYYGGGGGASSGATAGAGGGGGGSSYVTGINTSIQAGSGTTPGNASDPDRNGAGTGGNGGATTANGIAGANGLVIITPVMVYASPAVQQTALLSQPQVAKYSIMFDTDTDVFPNYWLMNGLDNSIGARWQLSYRSMANQQTATKCATMSTWGQATNFGNVTLGTPGTYTVKDGSGADIGCGRYFDFNVTVDSSQAFGYPDDVSRGPTISDLTFQFTADPSKRLMHGRTFIGGLQMPDDTPLYAN